MTKIQKSTYHWIIIFFRKVPRCYPSDIVEWNGNGGLSSMFLKVLIGILLLINLKTTKQ